MRHQDIVEGPFGFVWNDDDIVGLMLEADQRATHWRRLHHSLVRMGFGLALVGVSLTAIEPWVSPAAPSIGRAVAVVGAILATASVLWALIISRLGLKRRWISSRLRAELWRSFKFRYVLDNFAEAVGAARGDCGEYLRTRARSVADYRTVIEEDLRNLFSTNQLPASPAKPPTFDPDLEDDKLAEELLSTYERLRIDLVLSYTHYMREHWLASAGALSFAAVITALTFVMDFARLVGWLGGWEIVLSHVARISGLIAVLAFAYQSTRERDTTKSQNARVLQLAAVFGILKRRLQDEPRLSSKVRVAMMFEDYMQTETYAFALEAG